MMLFIDDFDALKFRSSATKKLLILDLIYLQYYTSETQIFEQHFMSCFCTKLASIEMNQSKIETIVENDIPSIRPAAPPMSENSFKIVYFGLLPRLTMYSEYSGISLKKSACESKLIIREVIMTSFLSIEVS